MSYTGFYICIFLVFYIFHECQLTGRRMEMIPERAEISYINPKYIANASVAVRRISRGGHYVVHLRGYNRHVWNNNVTLTITFYEFLHNEYRKSFVEATYMLCDFINTDPYGKEIQKFGVVCPVYVKNWAITNATIILPSFPYVFPFTKCKAEVVLKKTSSEELMIRGYIYVLIKQS